MINIKSVDLNFEREPLRRAFGFKGGYVSELWQTVALLESDSGIRVIGLGTQSVLWSDAAVFAAHSEAGGNALMYALSEFALQQVRGISFSDPISLLDEILGETYEYGKRITRNDSLRQTFVLNALVAVDNAAWLLYARENGFGSFNEMVPAPYRSVLSSRHAKVASIPQFSFKAPVSEIIGAVDKGHFILKLKLGPPGRQEEMLKWDMRRIEEIHIAVGHRETPHTENGKILYYLDPNGRYRNKETLLKLLDHVQRIGAMGQILLVEEPFPENFEVEVGDIGVRVAADESAHTENDTVRRIQMGYGAVALKPVAKTLSMTLKIARAAFESGVPCFCADLTVNPILVDWNKNVAARLAPFPGLRTGLLENNGYQNYKRWDKLIGYHPCAGETWIHPEGGEFNLKNDFYAKSGGIFEQSKHYMNLF